MSFLQGFGRHFVTPIDRGEVDPPTDALCPRDHWLAGYRAGGENARAATGDGAQLAEALRLVEAALALESERARRNGMRNADLANLCLEVRSALRPSVPGSEALREVPDLGIRHAGRAA